MARNLVQRIVVNYLLKSHRTCALSLQLTRYLSTCKFASQKKLSHKDVNIIDHTCVSATYKEYLTNHKPIVQVMVQTLKEILDINAANANRIITAHPLFKKRSRMNVLNNYYSLLETGVQKATIAKNVWLLTHDHQKLKDKLDCISIIKTDNDELVPWLRLTQEELKHFINYIRDDVHPYAYNKIEHLAHRLECSVQLLCELTIRCSFLIKYPISQIDKKLNILSEYNINNKSILNDLWILRYSENHIRHRCELYKNTQSIEMKTWAIRCPLKIIERTIKRNQIERNLLQNHKDVSEYLINKLQVDMEILHAAIKKWPGILRVHVSKLDQIINMLHQHGICSKTMLRYGSIFYFNTETIRKRIEIIKNENLNLRLNLLTLGEKQFDQYIERHQTEQGLMQNCKDVKEYLMNKLNVDEETLTSATEKWPIILRVKIFKSEQLINLLQANGITSDDILRHGRVFRYKVETLSKRIEILKEINVTPKITVILYDQKAFKQYVISQTILMK